MTRALRLVVLVSAVTASACTRAIPASEAPTPVPAAQPSAPDAEEETEMLTCDATLTNGHLELKLALTNRTGHPIWVASELPVQTGSQRTADATAAYVVGDERGAVVTRRLVAVPDDIDVESPETPSWTRVEPGGTHTGRLVVPWPLVTRSPYAQAVKLGTPRSLTCELGYVVADGDTPPRYSDDLADLQQTAQAEVQVLAAVAQ